MLKIFRLVAAVVMTLAFSSAMAQRGGGSGLNTDKLFFGAGVSQNDVSGSDKGTGYQFFGGYEFGEIARNVNFDLEVGYMTTGDMDFCQNLPFFGTICQSAEAKGLWATGVGRFVLSPQFELLGRAGLDFGDDDGFMFGVGAGFLIDKRSSLRLELVERDNVSSLQLNFVYRP